MDQRLQPRVKISSLGAEIMDQSSLPGGECRSEPVTVLNVSEAGMLYKSRKGKKVGETLVAAFTLPNTPLSIRSSVTVIHCTCEWPNYHIGVQFKNLGLAERKVIRDFIRMEMENDSS
ncbi:hypothetical protein CHISP_3006 [Chitinispirillum alkaliphilum]|nr:hypothetical protein CHISP_3006 [Chitinispirillum alkaliphilum]